MSNPNRPRWRTLSERLEELERTDPDVAKAAQSLRDLPYDLRRMERHRRIKAKYRGVA